MMDRDAVQIFALQNLKLYKLMEHVKDVHFIQNLWQEKETVELTNVIVTKNLLKMELAKTVLIIMEHHLVEKNVSQEYALMKLKSLIQMEHVKLVLKIIWYLRVGQSVLLLFNRVAHRIKDHKIVVTVVQIDAFQASKLFKQTALV